MANAFCSNQRDCCIITFPLLVFVKSKCITPTNTNQAFYTRSCCRCIRFETMLNTKWYVLWVYPIVVYRYIEYVSIFCFYFLPTFRQNSIFGQTASYVFFPAFLSFVTMTIWTRQTHCMQAHGLAQWKQKCVAVAVVTCGCACCTKLNTYW